jgi:hypothetical protein
MTPTTRWLKPAFAQACRLLHWNYFCVLALGLVKGVRRNGAIG